MLLLQIWKILLDIIDKEIWYQEMPLAGSSLLAQWFVMEKAKGKEY